MSVSLKPIQVYVWTCPKCGEINELEKIDSDFVTCEKCPYAFDFDIEKDLKDKVNDLIDNKINELEESKIYDTGLAVNSLDGLKSEIEELK